MNSTSDNPGYKEHDEHVLSAKPQTSLRIGSLEWERAGGPPLSFGQKLTALGEAGIVVLAHYGQMFRWQLGRLGLFPALHVKTVDLSGWALPDTHVAREAESYLREVSTPEMINHSLRTYYFSGILYELSGLKQSLDREALYVAALMHDVGLFQTSPPASEHCFTVGSTREARRIMKNVGWDDARQNNVAVTITSNLNSFVPIDEFGLEAHFMRAGGLVEVIAQEWKISHENVTEILKRCPREGFAADALMHIEREMKWNPGCRFACLDPLFPMMLRRSKFSQESSQQ
jgi:hypothetical protein